MKPLCYFRWKIDLPIVVSETNFKKEKLLLVTIISEKFIVEASYYCQLILFHRLSKVGQGKQQFPRNFLSFSWKIKEILPRFEKTLAKQQKNSLRTIPWISHLVGFNKSLFFITKWIIRKLLQRNMFNKNETKFDEKCVLLKKIMNFLTL